MSLAPHFNLAFWAIVFTFLPISNSFAKSNCIQHPQRVAACPHQIYKLMQLDPNQSAKITCICLSDFKKFLTEPQDKLEQQLHRLEIKRLAADLQLSEHQVKNLARR